MSHYINPPESVSEIGRPLYGRDYANLVAELRHGELLYGLGDRMIFKFASHLYSASEFEEIYSQYRSGNIISMQFFAVPAQKANSRHEQIK